jgi:hypothetical protein
MAKKPAQTPGDAPASDPLPESAAHNAAADAVLPNAIDVDARFLRGPVLTKQGYVVPDEAWQKANAAEFQAALNAKA